MAHSSGAFMVVLCGSKEDQGPGCGLNSTLSSVLAFAPLWFYLAGQITSGAGTVCVLNGVLALYSVVAESGSL